MAELQQDKKVETTGKPKKISLARNIFVAITGAMAGFLFSVQDVAIRLADKLAYSKYSRGLRIVKNNGEDIKLQQKLKEEYTELQQKLNDLESINPVKVVKAVFKESSAKTKMTIGAITAGSAVALVAVLHLVQRTKKQEQAPTTHAEKIEQQKTQRQANTRVNT